MSVQTGRFLVWFFVFEKVVLIFQVHKIVDLSAFPNREAMWYLEVMEAYELFYEPLVKEFV